MDKSLRDIVTSPVFVVTDCRTFYYAYPYSSLLGQMIYKHLIDIWGIKSARDYVSSSSYTAGKPIVIQRMIESIK